MYRIIPFLLITVLLLSGCSSEANEKDNIKKADKETLESKNVYIMAGKVQADNEVKITSKILGRVSHIPVDIGSKVEKGQPIVYLDTSDIQAQVNQAQAAVDTAKANLNKVESGSRPEQIAQAQANLKSAQKSYENVKINSERISQLYKDGAVSSQQMENAQAQLSASEAQYKSAQEQLNILNNGETSETINVYKSQVKQAEAALELTKTQLNNAVIVSPISGIVSAKNINEGEIASSGTSLISIVGSNSFHIDAYMPSRFSEKVNAGDEVNVKISEISDKAFSGKVTVVNPSMDTQGKNILVKIELINANSKLKTGMFAEIGLKK